MLKFLKKIHLSSVTLLSTQRRKSKKTRTRLLKHFLNLKHESGAGDVVAASCSLADLGADEYRGYAYVHDYATAHYVEGLVPARNRLLLVQGYPGARHHRGREAVIHNQHRFLYVDLKVKFLSSL